MALKLTINLESHWSSLHIRRLQRRSRNKSRNCGCPRMVERYYLSLGDPPAHSTPPCQTSAVLAATTFWTRCPGAHSGTSPTCQQEWTTDHQTLNWAQLAQLRLPLHSSMSQFPGASTWSLLSPGFFQVHLFQTFFGGLGTSCSAQVCDAFLTTVTKG